MARAYDDTSYAGGSSRFQTTEWTKILNSALGESILAELYMKYSRPVYKYLRRKGFSKEEAKDLIQGFFSEKVLGQQLLQKADRSKGKFRTFLLTAIRNYAIDLHRREHPTSQLDEDFEQPSEIGSPESDFDLAWAEELLQKVIAELEVECRNHGKQVHWEIFRSWLLEPEAADAKLDMSTICVKYGVESPDKAYNMIANIKGRFRKILRHHIRRHANSDADVDEEIKHFIQILSKSPPR
jgi:RNA polymerase sigma-70 factor (ECF subfamily)